MPAPSPVQRCCATIVRNYSHLAFIRPSITVPDLKVGQIFFFLGYGDLSKSEHFVLFGVTHFLVSGQKQGATVMIFFIGNGHSGDRGALSGTGLCY
jgi:hypothetical protein